MSGTVSVVTDSTAYLPETFTSSRSVTIVPLQVVMGGRSLAEGVEVTSDEVARALRAGEHVTTSRPSQETFEAAYRAAAQAGAESVVSVHLSGDLSGTVDTARSAARALRGEVPVEVVDSRSLGLGLGYAVVAAAAAAAAGAPREEVARLALRRSLHATALFYVDTLEYLHRGGRIGATQARFGSALSVKPLLHLVDGRLEVLERVRTAGRALDRLVEIAVAEAGDAPVDVAVHHLASPQRAEVMRGLLSERIPAVGQMYVSELGAVLGAHVGPGMLGVVLSPAT